MLRLRASPYFFFFFFFGASLNVLVLLLSTLPAGARGQDCRFQAATPYNLAVVQKCVSRVPFNETIRRTTLDTVRKTLDLYAFRETVRDSPRSGLLQHIGVDIYLELRKMQTKRYSSDWDFQLDLANMFLSFKDAHTIYQKPGCYNFGVVQPFALLSRMSSGKQQIYISGLYKWAQYWSDDFQPYINATVLAINGKDALQTLWDWALAYEPLSKDPGSAFNAVLQGHYQSRAATIFPLPASSAHSYKLQLPNGSVKTISVPWLAGFRQETDINARGCTAPAAQEEERESRNLAEVLQAPWPVEERGHALREKPENLLMQASDGSIALYNVSSNVIALRITSFAPQSTDDFLQILDNALAYASSANISYLILDVRGNGGGSICLGYQVLWRMMHERHPEGDYDVIESELMGSLFRQGTEMVQPNIFSASFYANTNGSIYNNLSFYSDPRNYTRGNRAASYTQPIHHPCTYNRAYNSTFLFQKILLLSDGLCGSTCAVFSTHLAAVDHCDTVAIGGRAGQAQQFFSFPGGEVLQFSYLQQMIQVLGQSNNPSAPRPFLNSASMSFAFLEIYPWKLPTQPKPAADRFAFPLEFVWFPADHRLSRWVFGDSSDLQLWLDALQFLPN